LKTACRGRRNTKSVAGLYRTTIQDSDERTNCSGESSIPMPGVPGIGIPRAFHPIQPIDPWPSGARVFASKATLAPAT